MKKLLSSVSVKVFIIVLISFCLTAWAQSSEEELLPAEEIIGSGSESKTPETVVKASDKTSTNTGSESIKTDEDVLKPTTIVLGREEIEEIIDASLDKKLAPIYDMMANTYDRGPGLTEIMGGIGYIIGLVGVALYFSNRRRKE